MAAHIEPPFSNDQIAWLDQRIADQVKAQVVHCERCWTSPISRVVACTEVDCPARRPEAA